MSFCLQLRERIRDKGQPKSQSPVRSLSKHDSDDKTHSKRGSSKRHERKIKSESEKRSNDFVVEEKPKIVDGESQIFNEKFKSSDEISRIFEDKSKICDGASQALDEKPKFIHVKQEIIEEKPKIVDTKPREIDEKPKIVDANPNVIDEKPKLATDQSKRFDEVAKLKEKEKKPSDEQFKISPQQVNKIQETLNASFKTDETENSVGERQNQTHMVKVELIADDALEEGEIEDDCDDANGENGTDAKPELPVQPISPTPHKQIKKIESNFSNASTESVQSDQSTIVSQNSNELIAVEPNKIENRLAPDTEIIIDMGFKTLKKHEKASQPTLNSTPADEDVNMDGSSHETEALEKPELKSQSAPDAKAESFDDTKPQDMEIDIIESRDSLPQINEPATSVKQDDNEHTSGTTTPKEKSLNGSRSEESKLSKSADRLLFDEILNTSGNKSVKNISTSSKDYLIVEDENDETTIYVTRKKKKKKKSEKKEKSVKSV